MPEVKDADVEAVLSRLPGWRSQARLVADAAYIHLREKIAGGPRFPEGTLIREWAEGAAFRLYERWCCHIDDGRFLAEFIQDPEKGSVGLQAIEYLGSLSGSAFKGAIGDCAESTLPSVEPEFEERREAAEDGNELIAWEPEEDELQSTLETMEPGGLTAADKRIIIEHALRGELPPPMLRSIPRRLGKEWLTGVHMSWPRLSVREGHAAEERLLDEAMKEAEIVTRTNDLASRAWFSSCSKAAQEGLTDRVRELEEELEKLRDKLNSAFGRRALDRLALLRERVKELEQHLLLIIVEQLVLQYSGQDYANVLGIKTGNAYRRRSRLRARLADIFIFGGVYQSILRVSGGGEE